jgi:argininosuccinate lyase
MPQKKNPDALELIRAKAGVSIGHLTSLLGILKGLPVGYNRDLQETKPLLISSEKTLTGAIEAMKITFDKLTVNSKKMLAACDETIFATDVTEAMVKEGIPFRKAYSIVAQSVRDGTFKSLATKHGINFDLYKSVSSKKSKGGTAPHNVEKSLRETLSQSQASEPGVAGSKGNQKKGE